MQITWDSSVSTENRALIQSAIDNAQFNFDFIPTAWTVQVVVNPGHNGNYAALTTTDGIGQPALTQFAPGIFEPGNALYVDEAFARECVLHELGHVVTLGNLAEQQQRDICTILGIDFDTQWYSPSEQWTQMGRESAAEIFKDFYAAAIGGRHFDNRTIHQLDLGGWNWFMGVIAQSMQSIQEDVPITRETAVYAPRVTGPVTYDFVVDLYDMPDDLYVTPSNNDAIEVQVLVDGTLADESALTEPNWNFFFDLYARESTATLADWTCLDSSDSSFGLWMFPQSGTLYVGGNSGDPGLEAVFVGSGFNQLAPAFGNVNFAYRSSNGDTAAYVEDTLVVSNPSWSFEFFGADYLGHLRSVHATPILWRHAAYQLAIAFVDPVMKFVICRPPFPVDIPVIKITRHKAPSAPIVQWPYAHGIAAVPSGALVASSVAIGVVR